MYAYKYATYPVARLQNKNTMRAGGNHNAGFTIVETMIVLGVSAALLAMGMLLIAGRQNKTEFQVAINGLKQQIEQTINETANGFYPNNGGFVCTGNQIAAKPVLALQATSSNQGSNTDCIFVGKVLAFGAAATGDDSTVIIYPMLGNRQYNDISDGIREVQNYTEAAPRLLAPGKAAPNSINEVIDASTTQTLQNGLRLVSATYGGLSVTSTSAVFALSDDLGQYGLSDGSLKTGVQSLNLYGWSNIGSAGFAAGSQDVSQFVYNTPGSLIVPLTDMQLCFASGGTKQAGKITIKGEGNLAVSLVIYSGTTTCP